MQGPWHAWSTVHALTTVHVKCSDFVMAGILEGGRRKRARLGPQWEDGVAGSLVPLKDQRGQAFACVTLQQEASQAQASLTGTDWEVG